ncbi:LppU/SCO3897 family protein [Streptomyces lavendulae]|uniref:LppU/SCO3897 family protein n=1 Tax=Streptomyces lavendulae TaxID=1914 RepID=UPI0036B55FF0
MTTPQNPQAQPSSEAFAATPFPYGEAIQEAAAAPKKSKRKKVLSLLGTLALIIVLAIVKVAIGEAINGPVHAKVGDCVTVTGSANNPSVDTVGCGDGKATHTVSKVVDDTFDINVCGDGFDALAQQLDNEKFVLCLTPKK